MCVLLLAMLGCEPAPQPVRIATAPWPGYEMLYLAQSLGYFKEEKLDITLVQIESWSDALRAYQAGRLDGFTNTLVEAVQAQLQDAPPLKVVLLTDYSNGADVIVSRTDFADIPALKGKKVGCDVSGLGLVVLTKALAKHQLTLKDVVLVNHEQLSGQSALEAGDIDALVTYPPVSLKLLENKNLHSLFDSKQIPGGILDVLLMSESLLKKQPEFAPKLYRAWQKAYEYTQKNPNDAFAIMAQQENIPASEFAKSFTEDIKVYSAPEMQQRLNQPHWLDAEAKAICEILAGFSEPQKPCAHLPSLYPPKAL